MIKIRIVTAFLIGLMAFALATTMVHAGTANTAAVWATSDNAGTIKQNFFGASDVGNTVYIWWSANKADGTAGTVDIEIVDSAGGNVAGPWTDLAITAQPQTWTLQPGYYYIVCTGAVTYKYPIAIVSVFILPESALGTLMATTAGFAAFGTIAIVKQKRTKKNKV